jgi:hypothetical protein
MNIYAPAFSLCVLLTMTSHAMEKDPKLESVQRSDHSSNTTTLLPAHMRDSANDLPTQTGDSDEFHPIRPLDTVMYRCLMALLSCFGPPEPGE